MPMRFLGGPSRSEITNVLVLDSLWDRVFYHQTLFQHDNGFEWSVVGSGTKTISQGVVTLDTGGVINSSEEMEHGQAVSEYTLGGVTYSDMSWNKERKFRVSIEFLDDADQLVYITTGGRGPPPLGAADQYLGFKIVNNQIFGCVGNGVVETLTGVLGTIGIADILFCLEVRFTPGVECRFYVNTVDMGAITTNLPAGLPGCYIWERAYITNTAAAAKSIQYGFWEFYQAR